MQSASHFHTHAVAQPWLLDVSCVAATGPGMTRAREGRPVAMITRRLIKPGCYSAFEAALQGFVAFATLHPGHVDVQIGWRIEGARREFAIVNRFAHAAARHRFASDPAYRVWLDDLRTLTTDGDGSESDAVVGSERASGSPDDSAGGHQGWKAVAIVVGGILGFTLSLPRLAAMALPAWPAAERDECMQALTVVTMGCGLACLLLWSRIARTSAALNDITATEIGATDFDSELPSSVGSAAGKGRSGVGA